MSETETREQPGRGSHAADLPGLPFLRRWGKLIGGIVLLVLIGVLLVFGDTIFGGGGGNEPGTDEPTLSEEKQEELQPVVTEAATKVLETWARPGAAYQGWWKQLQPMLTPGGREAYAFTNTKKLPELGELDPSGKPDFLADGRHATVYFETDAGKYGVDLSRRGRGWLANKVIFPGGESLFR